MFDKNSFKVAFRQWVEGHPEATEEEAKRFCQNAIPASAYVSHYWLVEQSLQWFQWLKRRPRADDLDLGDEDDEAPEGTLLN